MTKTVFSKLNKGLALLVLLVLTGCQSDRDPVSDYKNPPLEFKNPVFNLMIRSRGKIVRDYRITPTDYIDLERKEYSQKCQYLAEDDKAVFIKCSFKSVQSYHMFISRYRSDEDCSIWKCGFRITSFGYIDPYSIAYTTESFNCDKEGDEEAVKACKIKYCSDEPDEFEAQVVIEDSSYPIFIDCYYELKARGWDKYITDGKWREINPND